MATVPPERDAEQSDLLDRACRALVKADGYIQRTRGRDPPPETSWTEVEHRTFEASRKVLKEARVLLRMARIRLTKVRAKLIPANDTVGLDELLREYLRNTSMPANDGAQPDGRYEHIDHHLTLTWRPPKRDP